MSKRLSDSLTVEDSGDSSNIKIPKVNDDSNGINKKDDKKDSRSYNCPYLDTIKRQVLDFDFEKLCSVSLSKINCYACLVCGKFFQGKFCREILRFEFEN